MARNKYFDPKPPQLPEQVLDIPTKPLLDLIHAADKMALATPPFEGKTNVFRAKRHGSHVLTLFPLIERIQTGENLQPEDVRPYRRTIKKAVPRLSAIDSLAVASGITLVGIPARRALNNRVETEFIKRTPAMFEKGREVTQLYLPQIEQEIEYLSAFDSPREEFVSEVDAVYSAIRSSAQERAQVKGHTEVTASDAGFAIRHELGHLMLDGSELPMLQHYLLDKVPSSAQLPQEKILSIAAPEIMSLLEAPLAQEQRDSNFIHSLERHPHPLRAAASTFKGAQLRWLAETYQLLPSIRDLLPTTQEELKDRFNKVMDFLDVKTDSDG